MLRLPTSRRWPAGSVIGYEHPTLGAVRMVGSPFGAELTGDVAVRGPHLGEHTRELLGELCGYSDDALDALAAAGAFGELRRTDDRTVEPPRCGPASEGRVGRLDRSALRVDGPARSVVREPPRRHARSRTGPRRRRRAATGVALDLLPRPGPDVRARPARVIRSSGSSCRQSAFRGGCGPAAPWSSERRSSSVRAVERVSTIRDIVAKEGRSGPLVFVTIEHEIRTGATRNLRRGADDRLQGGDRRPDRSDEGPPEPTSAPDFSGRPEADFSAEHALDAGRSSATRP